MPKEYHLHPPMLATLQFGDMVGVGGLVFQSRQLLRALFLVDDAVQSYRWSHDGRCFDSIRFVVAT